MLLPHVAKILAPGQDIGGYSLRTVCCLRLAKLGHGDSLLALCMDNARPKILLYKRSRFATALPVDYLYSPSHAWIARADEGTWRVGLTKFATRMLGEMVDHCFEVESGALVDCGQIIGCIEGDHASGSSSLIQLKSASQNKASVVSLL